MSQQTYLSVTEQSRHHNETNDCAVKAVAIACNVAYSTAHAALKKHGRRDRKGTFHYTTFEAIKELGFKADRVTLNNKRTMRTVGFDCPRGRCLVFVHKHVAAMVDGKVQDWSAGRCHRVKSVYVITDPNAPVVVVEPTPVPAPGYEPLPKRAPRKFTGVDKFGSKIGSQSAQINEALGDYEWWTVTEIATKTGLSVSRVRNHMRWLTDRGWVHIKDNNKLYQLVCKYTTKEV